MRALGMILLAFLTYGSAAAVKDPVYDDFEGQELIEALIRDKRLDVAEAELRNMKPSDSRTRLTGQLYLAQQKFEAALNSFRSLPPTPAHFLLRGQAAGRAAQWHECRNSFAKSETLWLSDPANVILKASCEFQTHDHELTFSTLLTGYKKHQTFSIQRERVSHLLEMALTQDALSAALDRGGATTAPEILGLAELFQNKKLTAETLTLLEWARTRFPFDIDVNLSIAKVYYSKGQLRSTAEAFERAARTDRKFIYHAAELRRQMGDKQTASYWLPQIDDPKEKLRARLAFYVENGWYPLIASMDGVMASSSLAEDDEVRYAIGYSLFRQGEIEKPLKYLSQIRSPHHAARAAILRKSILDSRL